MREDSEVVSALHRLKLTCLNANWPGGAGIAENAIALIERLTPKPMTDDEVCSVLNEIAYDGGKDWKPDSEGLGFVQSESLEQVLGTWTAEAVAEKAKREREEPSVDEANEVTEVLKKLKSLMGCSVSHNSIGLDAITSAILLISQLAAEVECLKREKEAARA